MSFRLIDRAQDKVLEKLSPAELGQYVAELSDRYDLDIANGRMTLEGALWEIELIKKKFLPRMSSHQYIRYTEAKHHAVERNFLKTIGERDLEIIDLKITLLESVVQHVSTIDRLCTAIAMKDLPADEVEARLEVYLKEARAQMQPFLNQITALKRTYEEYTQGQVWKDIEKTPVHVRRENPETAEFMAEYGL